MGGTQLATCMPRAQDTTPDIYVDVLKTNTETKVGTTVYGAVSTEATVYMTPAALCNNFRHLCVHPSGGRMSVAFYLAAQ